jgi:MoxR-like ATPase
MSNEIAVNSLLELVDSMKDRDPIDEVRLGDRRDGAFYSHDARTRLALKVAIVTNRPLLLVGPPGCGKSSLAPYVARNLNMRYLSYTVTENAEASDVLWRVDYLKRLNDAQLHQIKPMAEYIDKGVLWRAFDDDCAGNQQEVRGTVVLIDEIDKASSSFANSLLVSLGSLEFEVPPLDQIIKANRESIILVIMTSNGERELPPALTRRCITLQVDYPTISDLVTIATRRWSWMKDASFCSAVESLANSFAHPEAASARISTAEFLDLVQVLKIGCIQPFSEDWKTVEGLVLFVDNTSD